MNQSQKRIVFLFIVSVSIYNSCALSRIDKRQNSEYQMARRITRDELPIFFDKIKIGTEQLYGFTNRDEFLTTEVGNPFNNYRFNGPELEKSTTISVPVLVADEYRAISSLDYINNTMHIVDFGAAVLAKEIQLVQKENMTLSFVGLLRIYRINSDFVIMSDNHENLFIPLTSAKIYLASAGKPRIEEFYTQSQILNIIKEISNE